jgi:hypothetical protein
VRSDGGFRRPSVAKLEREMGEPVLYLFATTDALVRWMEVSMLTAMCGVMSMLHSNVLCDDEHVMPQCIRSKKAAEMRRHHFALRSKHDVD